ncbi:MAG TPA: DUF72 domain-containing protein, partial [Alphaproteobacteria bacterium]|nr:DUF72 domain-containing protein [Alphaproteobacteria bacterium]
TIEINGTFYRTQTPASFKKWHDETPPDFVFSVKAPRYIVGKKELAGTAELIEVFLNSGLTELKHKLGPILWQLAPFKKFDPDISAFLKMLPHKHDGVELRHAIEIRSKSFLVPAFVDLARFHNVAIVYADSDDYPAIADVTSDFTYARLQRCVESEPAGYSKKALDQWMARAHEWENGVAPEELETYRTPTKVAKEKHDVFVYFISGAKVRAPDAAMAMIERLK